MPDNAEPSEPYKVGRLAVVNEQIRQIGQRAKLSGMRQEIEDALIVAKQDLQVPSLFLPQLLTLLLFPT